MLFQGSAKNRITASSFTSRLREHHRIIRDGKDIRAEAWGRWILNVFNNVLMASPQLWLSAQKRTVNI